MLGNAPHLNPTLPMKTCPETPFQRPMLAGRWPIAIAGYLVMAAMLSSQENENKTPEKIVVLSPFTVTGSSNVGYGATATGSSGRLSQAYIDTPQVTSVVTSEFMEDANLYNSMDAMRFVPNVQVVSQHAPIYSIRGIMTQRTYFDGFYGSSLVTVDTAFADRIEVVKGPSSAAFGRGDPAGFVNYVSKTPQFSRSTRLGVTVGTGNGPRNNVRFTLDNNGLVSESGNTAYRLVAAYARGSGTRDYSESERSGAQLSMVHRLQQRGDIKVVARLFRNHNGGGVGNTSYNDPHIQRFSLESSGNMTTNVPVLNPDVVFGFDGTGIEDEGAGITATLNYKLGDHWLTRHAVHYNDVAALAEVPGSNVSSVRRETDGTLTVQVTPIQQKRTLQSWSYQGDFLANYRSDFLKSAYSFLFGGDVTDETTYSAQQIASVPRQPLLNPNPHIAYSFAGNLDRIGILTKGYQWSPYAQLQGTFYDGRMQIATAARKLFVDQRATNLVNGSVTKTKNRSPILPTYSVLLKPAKWLSVYGLVTKYEEPAQVVSEFGTVPITDPRFGRTITVQPTTELHEFGIKGTMLNEKVTFSIARFDLRNKGAFRSKLVDSVNFISQGFLSNDRIEGWEIEVFGQPNKHLTFMCGAGFIDSEANVPTGDSVYLLEYPNLAETVYGYLKYSFGATAEKGLTATIGFKTALSGWNMNASFGPLGNRPYPDDKTVVDLGMQHGFADGRYQVGLKVNNAFSRHATVTGGYQYITDGRLVFLTLEGKF